LVLESAGSRTAGSERPRNDQYVPTLTLLLRRLGDRRAVLMSALVASARVSTVPVAMLACTFGCDALYEAGWITVGQDGNVQTVPAGQLA